MFHPKFKAIPLSNVDFSLLGFDIAHNVGVYALFGGTVVPIFNVKIGIDS
jgi:hypothetical protein